MPVPKTNLFKGDRVVLHPSYHVSIKVRNKHAPLGRFPLHRVGTIISDTLDPSFNCIVVWWDGNKHPGLRKDRGYTPEDLMLYEEE